MAEAHELCENYDFTKESEGRINIMRDVPKERPYTMAFLMLIGWLKARDKRREARYVYIPLR